MSDDAIFDELGRFDEGYAPQQAGQLPDLRALADGTYAFTVTSADLGRTKNSGQAILRLAVRPDGGGVYELPYFLDTQDKANRCGAELAAMGLVEFAAKGDFGRKMKAALPKLKGLRFVGTKTTSPNKNDSSKPYVNLFIAGPAGPGPVAGASRPASAPPPGRNATPPPAGQGGESDIPF